MKLADIEIPEERLMEEIRVVMRQRKRYAGSREGGNKHVKERAIVCEFLRAREHAEGCCWIRSVTPNPDGNAAPDSFGIDLLGKCIGFEVTELVDAATIVRHRPTLDGRPVLYRPKEWQPDELIQKVQAILLMKDGKDYKGAVFTNIVLIIHTDEPYVCHGDFSRMLAEHTFSACKKIGEAYILLSYQPRIQSYPYVRLRLG